MENTKDELKSAGFTDNEMKKFILWHDYIEKRMKMKNTKSFNRIVAVEIITNKRELSYFKKSLLGFGLTEKDHVFYNDFIHITCTLADIPTSELKSVEIELAIFLMNKRFRLVIDSFITTPVFINSFLNASK